MGEAQTVQLIPFRQGRVGRKIVGGPKVMALLSIGVAPKVNAPSKVGCVSDFCMSPGMVRRWTVVRFGQGPRIGCWRQVGRRDKCGLGRRGSSSLAWKSLGEEPVVFDLSALLAPEASLLLGLDAQERFNLWPGGFPAVATEDSAESQHRIDMRVAPVHAGALEAGFDDILVSAFDHAAADGPSMLAKRRIKHLALPLLQIGEVLAQGLEGGLLRLSHPQFSEHWLRPLMLEAVQPALRPRLCLVGHGARQCLSDFTDALCRMREIQDAYGMWTMMVGEPLQPVGAIHHGCHVWAVFNAALMGFDQRQARKLLCRRQTRKIGVFAGAHFPLGGRLHFPNNERPHFFPLAMH